MMYSSLVFVRVYSFLLTTFLFHFICIAFIPWDFHMYFHIIIVEVTYVVEFNVYFHIRIVHAFSADIEVIGLGVT